jgi:hypothetical protein
MPIHPMLDRHTCIDAAGSLFYTPVFSSYSPSPECPARKSGDEWRGEPSEALAKEGSGLRRVPHSC